tara:strand:- start:197 stop:1081 length:885 start_codon:yes stop_codon:yes gene_type:complete
MKKALSFVFLIAVLLFASIGSEFIKPYTIYFTKTLIDKDDPFNFKNEYELLIWQNEQKETIEVFRNTLDSIVLEVGDKDMFTQCVIDKNIDELKSLDESKLNPINPKTVDDLSNELKRYQPLMIDIQTKSFESCKPKKEIDTRDNILLSCECKSVEKNTTAFKHTNCSSRNTKKGTVIDFKNKLLIYGDMTYELFEDEYFYVGIDINAWGALNEQMDELERRHQEKKYDSETLKTFQAEKTPAVKIERLSGHLEHNQYFGYYANLKYSESVFELGGNLIPAFTVKRECSVVSKI